MTLELLTGRRVDPSQPIMVGLTGGIGSGKSTVGHMLRSLGATVVDADTLARQVVEPGTVGLRQVVRAFGTRVLGPDRSLDRAALGALVFSEPELLAELESITHPLIEAARRQAFSELQPGEVGVYEVPLLVEREMHASFDCVVVVEAAVEEKLERLGGRGINPEQARKRMKIQASDAQRRDVADFVITNDSDVRALEEDVRLLGKYLGLWRDWR